MLDLFADSQPWQEPLAPGAVILRRFAFSAAPQLVQEIETIAHQSPFRQMITPGGYDVGGDDQLWTAGLDDRQPRLPLFACRSVDGARLA